MAGNLVGYVVKEILYTQDQTFTRHLKYDKSWDFFDALEEAYPYDEQIVGKLIANSYVLACKGNTLIEYYQLTKPIVDGKE